MRAVWGHSHVGSLLTVSVEGMNTSLCSRFLLPWKIYQTFSSLIQPLLVTPEFPLVRSRAWVSRALGSESHQAEISVLTGDAALAGAWGSLPNSSRFSAEFNFLLLWDQGSFLWLAVSGVPQVGCKLLTTWQLTFSKPEGDCPFSLLIIIQYNYRSDGPFIFVICQQSDSPLCSQVSPTLEGRGFMRGMCTSRWESWGRGGHHRILPITAWMQTNRENSPKTLEGRGNKVTCFLLWTLPFKLSHGLIFSYVSLWLFQLTCLFAFSLLRRSFLLIPRGLKDAWVIFHIPWTFILVFCYEGPS